MSSWKVTLPCTRAEAEHLSGDLPELSAGGDPPVLVTSEIDEASETWQLDAYFEDQPDPALLTLLTGLIPSLTGQRPVAEQIIEQDWVTVSQAGIEPVHAGRFYVHTVTNRGIVPDGAHAIRIDASQAFGTGTHETTAGCLAQLDRLQSSGRRFTAIADIGTGTGLLAFAALHLWPRAAATASDIDPVSIVVTEDNAVLNGVPIGPHAGAVATCVAPGTNHPLIAARAPYDLVIANILAGPLITLAPDIAAITAPRGTIVLAGLILSQADAVIATYRRHGFRLVSRTDNGDWPTLCLIKRPRYGWRRPQRDRHASHPADARFGSW